MIVDVFSVIKLFHYKTMTFSTRRDFVKNSSLAAALFALSSASVSQANPETKKNKKILMPIGDATETIDTLYPYFRLPEAGYDLVVCGPEARLYHSVLHEIPPDSPIPWDITQERPSYFVEATVAFKDVDPSDYCSVFASGGRAPEYLRNNKDLVRIMRHFAETKKPIASVCHGIELLTAGDCIRGKKVTAVPKCQMDAEQGGATFLNQPVVRDGNVICCRTWHDYTPFFQQYIKMLEEMT